MQERLTIHWQSGMGVPELGQSYEFESELEVVEGGQNGGVGIELGRCAAGWGGRPSLYALTYSAGSQPFQGSGSLMYEGALTDR